MAENDSENGGLTPKQTKALAALLTSPSNQAAAAAAGVSERQLARWLADKNFRAELQRQQGAMLDQVTRGLLAMQADAMTELHDLITGLGGVAAGIRLQAIRTVLEYGQKYIELNDLERRLAALEGAANEKQP